MKNYSLINARKLSKILLMREENFPKWIKNNIEKNKLIENVDYFIEHRIIKSLPKINKSKTEYLLTENACREILVSKRKYNVEIMLKKLKEEEKDDIKIIPINNKYYPNKLRKIKNPPQKLYIKGNIENLQENAIAVIGTRNCSNYGRRVCKVFTNNLVGYNFNIISGLAIGIDSCAHKSCLEANGKTIAVLPSGFNNIFPEQNESLVKKIIEQGGTIVTEYPPDYEKTQESCRERNRIMSGLALGTLVIEAEARSGTSITVRNTIEQNKKVFCIPSSLYNTKGVGTNEMIKSGKGKIVTNIQDIIMEYKELNLHKRDEFEFLDTKEPIKKSKKSKENSKQIEIESENAEIYNLLETGAKDINEIAIELDEPISQISYKLMMLELQGLIEELPNKKYRRIKNV